MSDVGNAISYWWSQDLDRKTAHGRRLSATLRRADAVAAMSEPRVHHLAQTLGCRDAEKLVRLVTLLAEVRVDIPQPLARVVGGSNPALSKLRFQRLLRAEGDDLTNALRRAIAIAGHRCNVATLGEDLFFWSNQARMRWCFHYFGAEAPRDISEETD